MLKRSGVYVIEDTGGPIFAERKVSDYYGCEWPDSVIVAEQHHVLDQPDQKAKLSRLTGTQITPIIPGGADRSKTCRHCSGIDKSDYGKPPRIFRNGLGGVNQWRKLLGITPRLYRRRKMQFNGFKHSTAILSLNNVKRDVLNVPTGRLGVFNNLLTKQIV